MLSGLKKILMKLKCILLSQRSQSEEAAFLYDSNYIVFWKRQKYRDNRQASSCQGWLNR